MWTVNSQDLLISAPQNPVYKLAISFNLKLRRLWREQGTSSIANAEDTVIALGPHSLFTAASFVMFGTNLQRSVGEDVGDRIRKAPHVLVHTGVGVAVAPCSHACRQRWVAPPLRFNPSLYPLTNPLF